MSYARGDLVVVGFGAGNWGRQVAFVLEHNGEQLRVRKWRKNSRRWSGSVGVAEREVKRIATADDLRVFKVGTLP